MRRGRVFKRCSRCGARVADRRCPKCSAETAAWCYVVDAAPPGAPRQQRSRTGFATKAAAVEAMNALQAAKADGTFVEPSKLTLGAFLESWLLSGCVNKKGYRPRPYTLMGYSSAMRVHVIPRIGGVLLQQLDRATIKKLYEQLRLGGYAKGSRAGKALAPKTVHNVHVALHAALEVAVADHLLAANPADGAHAAPGQGEQPEMLTWTTEELRTFLASVADDPQQPMWRLAAQTGLRRGELLGLRWDDLDLDGARLSVKQQLGRVRRTEPDGAITEAWDLTAPKTKRSRRSISLDAGTVAQLKIHRAKQELTMLPGLPAPKLVFGRPDGHWYDPDAVSDQFIRAVRRAGLKRIRLHDLRHTHATLLLAAAVNVKVVSERLGHASAAFTMDRYAHVLPSMQEEAALKIGALVD